MDGKISENLSIRRHILPHWQFGGSTYYVTFCSLLGELPDAALKQTVATILYDHGKRMDLHFAVVMPDHVHLIAKPREISAGVWHDLSKILQGIKGTSSRRINQLLHSSGQVWQNESYDRIIRNEEEYLEKLNYMWMNPVKAGLVDDPNSYPYLVNPMNVISIVAPKDGGCRG